MSRHSVETLELLGCSSIYLCPLEPTLYNPQKYDFLATVFRRMIIIVFNDFSESYCNNIYTSTQGCSEKEGLYLKSILKGNCELF
jgi:hypothetical protein